MPGKDPLDRRHFLNAATLTFAAAQFGLPRRLEAELRQQRASTPGGATMFGTIKQVNAGVLNVGYAEAGPADGKPVVLLHGWPYDIHTYVDVAPLLAAAGYRVIVPYLRGHGSTRFLSAETPRNGQGPVVTVPSITLEGDANGAPHPDRSVYAGKFSGKYRHHAVTGGIGHNLPQEAPRAFADAIIEADRL